MEFYKYLYIGEKATENQARIIWKLKHNAGQLNVYVVALASISQRLEIYHCALLQQKYYQKSNPLIIGIAKGYEEAVALVSIIAQEVYEHTGELDIKGYLLDKQNSNNKNMS